MKIVFLSTLLCFMLNGFTQNASKESITKNLMQPHMNGKSEPAWTTIHKKIKAKYSEAYADSVVLVEKVIWYEKQKDWNQFAACYLQKLNKYGYDTSWWGIKAVNDVMYSIIFKQVDDKKLLEQAAEIMKPFAMSTPARMDTYANLLYKSGKKAEAIAIQEEAVKRDADPGLKETLDKMKNDFPPPVDFSGKWLLNVSKSEFNNVPVYAAVKSWDFRQKENKLEMKWITLDEAGVESINTENITLDGKVNISLTTNGEVTKKTTGTWSVDKEVLTTKTEYSKPHKPDELNFTITRDFELQENGKEFKLKWVTDSYTLNLVYDKQE